MIYEDLLVIGYIIFLNDLEEYNMKFPKLIVYDLLSNSLTQNAIGQFYEKTNHYSLSI